MTKQVAKCAICDSTFTYSTTSYAIVDLDCHGFYLCRDCDKRGLGFFSMAVRDAVKDAKDKASDEVLKLLRKFHEVQGDWWTQKSGLHRLLKLKDSAVKVTFTLGVDGEKTIEVVGRKD